MRDSLKKIRSMCWPQPEESHWFLQLEQSGWLKHLKVGSETLRVALQCCVCMCVCVCVLVCRA